MRLHGDKFHMTQAQQNALAALNAALAEQSEQFREAVDKKRGLDFIQNYLRVMQMIVDSMATISFLRDEEPPLRTIINPLMPPLSPTSQPAHRRTDSEDEPAASPPPV